MIKMIFSDMDGTLLDEWGELPPGFDEMAAKLKQRGVIFCPASGRQYTALLMQLGDYVDDFVFLSENGTCVTYQGKELFSSPMPRQKILELLAAIRRIKGAYPVLCSQRVAYVESVWEPYRSEMDKFFTVFRIVNSLENVVLNPLYGDIVKVAVATAEGGDAGELIYPHLQCFEPELKVILSSDYWVDIQLPVINKGIAAAKTAAHFGIDVKDCAAFGDYLNDLEMISTVGYGFAMANAHPDLKQAARYIAPPNTEYGVVTTIEKLIKEGLI